MTAIEIEKYDNVMQDLKVKCSCGHKTIFVLKDERKLCDWCGYYVYKNPIVKFKYEMKKRLRKNK